MWSGALRSWRIKLSSESRNPFVRRSGRPLTTRSYKAVRIERFEYRRWTSRRPFFGGIYAAIASSLSQTVTSPRFLRPRSYSLQFRTLRVLTRSLFGKESIDRDMLELAFRVLVEAAHPDIATAVTVHGVLPNPVCQEEVYHPVRDVSINPK